MTNKTIYELSPAQDVPYLQCKYTLFKRVINILSSITLDEDVDFEVMKDAYNKVVERNDCLRIKFFKKKGQLMQYFDDPVALDNIPLLEFKAKEEQDAFIAKIRKSGIKFLKGKVIEPYFIKTFDGKNMIFLKVCHLVLDIYGLNVIYKDLLGVYNALKNNKPLPEAPKSYEEVVKKDIEKKHNKEAFERSKEYFQTLFDQNPEPYFTGLHGPEEPIWKKQVTKGRRGAKMFFIHNDTTTYYHKIDSELVNRALAFCQEKECSPANFMFYACSLTASRLNNNAKRSLPLELLNCRGSALEKQCAGTKVQSLGCYTTFDYNANFADNFKKFCSFQFISMKRIGFPDREFETLLHKTYRSPLLETYYFLTYSFIPLDMPDGVSFTVYSNEKGALPSYVVQIFDTKTNEINMAYDVQTKTHSEQSILDFHTSYVKVLNQILDNPEIKIADLEL